MFINPNIIKQVRNKIKNGDFNGASFEEFCITLFKRKKKYSEIRSDNVSITGNAQAGIPDAYIYDESKNGYIIFEFTENKRLREYILGSTNSPGLLDRKYLAAYGNDIINFILVTSQVVEDKKRKEFKAALAERYNCTCEIKDNEDISKMLFDGRHDLIKHYFGIDICPNYFITVKDAIQKMADTAIGFPNPSEFEMGELFSNKDVNAKIEKKTSEKNFSLLFYGRWGAGKTVLSFSTAIKLGRVGYQCYYLNLLEESNKNEESFANKIINQSIKPFADKKVIFIVDNAHAMPITAYRIARYMTRNKHNIILTSRFIPSETDFENYNYSNLFGAEISTSNNIVFLEISEKLILDVATYYNNKLNVLSEEELNDIFKIVGPNLTLLNLYFNVKKSYPTADPKKEIYKKLNARYTLNIYKEWYIIAALSCLDCPVDLMAAIPDSDRRHEFIRQLNSKHLAAKLYSDNFIMGMSAAEGRLLCEAAFDGNETFPFISEQFTMSSIEDIISVLIVHYSDNKPHNPYQLMKSIKWAAFEAKEQRDYYQEEQLVNLLADLFGSKAFVDHLGVVYSKRLSILALGELYRLMLYAKISLGTEKKILDTKSLKNGMSNLQVNLALSNKELWFTWQGYFAWRQINNINKDIADQFLSYFSDEMLLMYAKRRVNQLSNLLYMALSSQRVRHLVHKNIEEIFNDNLSSEISNYHEATMVFLYKNASRVSEHTKKKICHCIPPKKLAKAVGHLDKLSGSIFYTIHKSTFLSYYNEFISAFSREELYRYLYQGSLAKISWCFDNQMFNHFMKYDFEQTFLSSDMKQIQLFLRNILRHGFRPEHQKLVRERVKQKLFSDYIFKKFEDPATQLRDINYFSANYWILNPDAARVFYNILFDKIEEWGLAQRGSLADLSIFLLNSYIITEKTNPLLEYNRLKQYILKKTTHITTYDLLMFGGYLRLTNSTFRFPILFEDRLNSVINFFRRYTIIFHEDDDNLIIANHMIRYSCLINGLYYYGNSIQDVYESSEVKENAAKIKNMLDVLQKEDESPSKNIKRKILSDTLDKFSVLLEGDTVL